MTPENDIQYLRLKTDEAPLARMRRLNELFAIAFEDEDAYAESRPADAYLLSFLSKPAHIVWIAEHDDRVVGGLVAYVLEKFERQRSEIYIYDLAVTENFRRQKIATNLIGFLQKEAATTPAWVIFVQADPEDAPALKLYESLGIREDVYHFDIPVNR